MPFDSLPLPEDDHRLVREAISANVDQTLAMLPEVAEETLARHVPLRSAVVLETCRSLGGTTQELHTVAAVLEYLHVAALLHRDLDIAENARRQQHEVQQLWGSEASILLGDYLLSISFQTLTRLGNLEVLEAVARLTKDIARGQILEISGDCWSVPPAQWEVMIQQKRASLMATGAKCGALWAGADENQQAALYEYGLQLGVAVQAWEDWQTVRDPEAFRAALGESRPLLPVCLRLHDPDASEIQAADVADLPESEKTEWLLEQVTSNAMTERMEAWVQARLDAACAALDQISESPLAPLRDFATLNTLSATP